LSLTTWSPEGLYLPVETQFRLFIHRREPLEEPPQPTV